jgi:3-hydroxyisobutyrate dehydrogenase-like beta-hydroxyacid dehydrogenase
VCSSDLLGLSGATPFAPTIGAASAAKMCRSVMIKGLEALLAESLLAARHYGVEATVLSSLGDLLPIENWDRRAADIISRSLQHGRRRAEEMREVATTVAEAGTGAWMSSACARRQDWAADHRVADLDQDLPGLLDAVLAQAGAPRRATR